MKKHKYDIGQLVYFRIGSIVYRSRITLMRCEGNEWFYTGAHLPDWVAETDIAHSLAMLLARQSQRSN